MIICPNNYDWILAGDVYMAALIENVQHPENVRVEVVDFEGGLITPVDNINGESIISIIGHGSPGSYEFINARAFVNILLELGLNGNYSGTIEYYTCDSAIFDVVNPNHSLAHLTKNEFPLAKVVGAKGPSIIGYDKCRYIVNPVFSNNAGIIQGNLTQGHNFNQIMVHNDIFDNGMAVRNHPDVRAFYDNFIRQLKEKNYLVNGLAYLV